MPEDDVEKNILYNRRLKSISDQLSLFFSVSVKVWCYPKYLHFEQVFLTTRPAKITNNFLEP
jgi:hypothetical protein